MILQLRASGRLQNWITHPGRQPHQAWTIPNQHSKNTVQAETIKTQLLAWTLPRIGAEDVVASELRFLGGRRRADLAICNDQRLIGFEIKAPNDRIDRLANQLEDYLRSFHATYVVVAEKELEMARELSQRGTGIIVISKDGPKVQRTPRPRKLLSSAGSSLWLNREQLLELLGEFGVKTQRNCDTETARQLAINKVPRQVLNSEAIRAALSRSRPKYSRFLTELGMTPTLDDVKLLSAELFVTISEAETAAAKYED